MATIHEQAQRRIQKILDNADIEELLKILDTLDQKTQKRVLQVLSGEINVQTKQQTLAQIRVFIQESDVLVKEWLTTAIAGSYVTNLNNTDRALKKFGKDVPDGDIEVATIKTLPLHAGAVNALLSDSYLDFANGLNGLVTGVEHQLNETLKRQVRVKMIKGQITGQGIQEIKKEIVELLGEQGFSILIDRGGRQWTLRRYGEMLARTHIIRSSNEAVVNRAGEFGVDILQVSEHSGVKDQICLDMQGRIFSISGKSKKYPKLDFQPPFHPNCKHTLLMRPDLE